VRNRHVLLIAAAAVVPRIAVLLHERDRIITAFTEKGDDFAQTFVHHGTFGYLPGEPSAYTQPLYGFFLVPLYWIFGRRWEVVGIAQILVALGTAVLVYAIGLHVTSSRGALLASLISTLNPYLVWHDVHVNREIVDQLVAAAFVLCTVRAVQRRSFSWACAAGVCAGLGVLGNSRLLLVPVLLGVFLLWRLGRRSWPAAAALIVCAAVALAPWVIRNKVELGCFAITTDARALWKANNLQTYHVLASGHWIDDVKDPHHPFDPQEARDLYRETGRKVHVPECKNASHYQHRVYHFWREHPGAKAKLMFQAVRMEWGPRTTKTASRPERGSRVDTARKWIEPIYVSLLFAFGIFGLAFLPRWFAVLVLALLAYETLAAMVFVGATRYRVAWDFLIALSAGAALARLWERRRA